MENLCSSIFGCSNVWVAWLYNILLDRYSRERRVSYKILIKTMDRKYFCCLCKNTFDVEDLSPMPDGGSGGCCKECKEKIR